MVYHMVKWWLIDVFFACWMVVMWVEPCHKPTMYKNGGDWGMVYDIVSPTLRDLGVASGTGRWTFCCKAVLLFFSQTRNVFLVTAKSFYVSNTLLLFNLVWSWHIYVYTYHIDWAKTCFFHGIDKPSAAKVVPNIFCRTSGHRSVGWLATTRM